MGIRYLGHIIDSNRWANAIHLSRYQGRRVAIDTNLFLYKLNYQYGNIIDGLFLLVNKLVKYRIIPVFVFDGRPPAEKADIIQKRRRRRDMYREKYEELQRLLIELEKDNTNPGEISSCKEKMSVLDRKMFVVSREVIEKAQEFIGILGFNWIRYECEGEHMCAYLSRENLVDAVITDDMDALACGAKVVLRGFSTRYDMVEEIRLVDCLRGLNTTLEGFRMICVLTGTEYGPYDESIVEKGSVSEIINLVRKEGMNWLEGSSEAPSIRQIQDYCRGQSDFVERCRSILMIFALQGIELNYNDRRELIKYQTRSGEKIMEYMRLNSSLPAETIRTRIDYMVKTEN